MTVRTIAQLLTQFATGQPAKSIDPPDMQDLVDTLNALTNGVLAPNLQTGNYTFLLSDIATWTWMNLTGTANTLTVPPNVFPVGQLLSFGMFGTGVTTITPGAGVTVNPTTSLVLARHQSGVLYQIQTNVWESST